jgi:hypothetical protein
MGPILAYRHERFDLPTSVGAIEEFTDVIGRQFRQPREGLGFDNSPVAHMWRSMMFPDNPL